MNVYWIWSLECDTCQAFAEGGVVDLIADTIIPLPDVFWMQRRIGLVGSTDPTDAHPAPPLTTNQDGEIEPVLLFESPLDDLEAKADEDLYTPCMILEAGDATEQVDVAAYVDQTTSDVVREQPWLAARSLLKKTFRFYIEHRVETSPTNKTLLRRSQQKGSVQYLEPQYEYGKFKSHEWQDAFSRARQVNY